MWVDVLLFVIECVVIEEFLDGSEYCVEYFDGCYVGVLCKLKWYGVGFFECGYMFEFDFDVDMLCVLIDVGMCVMVVVGFMWGFVYFDCIVYDCVLYVIELNLCIVGSFICDIVCDGYGFNVVEVLFDKFDGRMVMIFVLFELYVYVCVEFLFDSDFGVWCFV